MKKYIGIIETYNSLGYNVCRIDDSHIVFTEFNPAQELVTETTVVGKNIDNIIEQQMNIQGVNRQGLISQLDNVPSRRTVYHKDVQYVKYIGNGGH